MSVMSTSQDVHSVKTGKDEEPRPSLPPLSAIIKSREVEDPVNTWVHRPLAYALVALLYRTPVTPNQVTFMAMVLGLSAAAFWIVGTPTTIAIGGALLWASAIADGADGLLARAKRSQSLFGRALDGSADAVVAAATMAAVIWYFFVNGFILEAVLTPFAIVLTLAHLQHYDFYKEVYLGMTRTDGGHELDDPVGMQALIRSSGDSKLIVRFVVNQIAAPYLLRQQAMVRVTNPEAKALFDRLRGYRPTEEAAAIYRKHNRWLMQSWAAVSLAPHSYLLAICALLNTLDTYLWLRLLLMNVVFAVALVLQRRATRRTVEEFLASGEGPPGLTNSVSRVSDL